MEINLRWNVALSSLPREAVCDGQEKLSTQNPSARTAPLQREAGARGMFLKVSGSLRLGPESGGKYCRDQQESGVASERACLGFVSSVGQHPLANWRSSP